MAKPRKTPQGTFRAEVMIDGERHSRTFPLRREAAEWIRAAEVDSKRGKFVPPDKLREKVGVRLDAWLAEKAAHPSFAEGSLRVYKSDVECHIRPPFGDLAMEALTGERIRTWQYQLAEDVSTATAKRSMKVLGSFLSAQVADGYLAQHPFDRVKDQDRVRHQPKRMSILEPHELRAVVAALADGPVHSSREDKALFGAWRQDVVLGLAFIGCRVGDLSRLRPEDWDRVNDRLHVRDQKTGTERWLPVFPAVREVLERCVARGGEFLFMTDGLHGQAVLRGQAFAKRHFNPALAKVGVGRHVRIHDLRHGCASWLIKQGFGPVHVAAYLGHSNPTTTMRTYAHLFASDMVDMGDALDQMWERAHQSGNVTPIRKAAE